MERYPSNVGRQDWNTPENVLSVIRGFAEIELDPCHNPGSIVGAKRTIMLPDCGLASPWGSSGLVFVNPPFAKPKPWIDKCVQERAANPDLEVILLLNASTETNWFQETLYPNAESILLWKGRLVFIGAPSSHKWPTCLSYFGARGDAFRAAFGGRGILLK